MYEFAYYLGRFIIYVPLIPIGVGIVWPRTTLGLLFSVAGIVVGVTTLSTLGRGGGLTWLDLIGSIIVTGLMFVVLKVALRKRLDRDWWAS